MSIRQLCWLHVCMAKLSKPATELAKPAALVNYAPMLPGGMMHVIFSPSLSPFC